MFRRFTLTSCRALHLSSRVFTETSNAGLVVSDEAVKRLKQIAKPGEALRVTVEGGGCSGFEYKLDLDSKVTDEDEIIERDGARVVVDKMSLEYVKGSKVDYQTDLIRAAFRIVDNPLADKGCSCGTSFSVKI